jgi:pyruvate formate lyase activating enzyme
MSVTRREIDEEQDNWRREPRLARHWRPLDGTDRVECTLSPRHCKIGNGQSGFCGVRRNIGGVLYSDNYGQAVAAAEEVIETEAIYHYRPGARILSMGNIGCMMSCQFCQNWTTSQVKHLDTRVIQSMSPIDVINIAQQHEIEVISWTYNDPVVWHEFVMETSLLARGANIRTLFKSALYVEAAPLDELLDVIDIWSVSLKSLDEKFYKKVTAARLGPVLDRIREIHATSRHLEISQLLVTDLNDTEDDIRKTVDWHLENLDENVPLHFVRFHPAFRYLNVERTPEVILRRAADIAREAGIRFVYLGNLLEPGVSDSHCPNCSGLLVKRYGLATDIVGIDDNGRCTACGTPSPIVEPKAAKKRSRCSGDAEWTGASTEVPHEWSDEASSIHIQSHVSLPNTVTVSVDRGDPDDLEYFQVGGNLTRALISRRSAAEQRITLRWPTDSNIQVTPVFDRAHLYTGDN